MLAPIESRFPLSRGRSPEAVREAEPDSVAGAGAHDAAASSPRRFGLRFFVLDGPAAQHAFRYCEHQQVMVDDEGRPVVAGPRPGWEQTSTGNMDGNEETKMDQDPDSA